MSHHTPKLTKSYSVSYKPVWKDLRTKWTSDVRPQVTKQFDKCNLKLNFWAVEKIWAKCQKLVLFFFICAIQIFKDSLILRRLAFFCH